MAEKKIIYEPHPVSPERKAELVAQGYKIVDAIFAPSDAAASGEEKGSAPKTDGGTGLVEIPDGWRDLQWKQRVNLAKSLGAPEDVSNDDAIAFIELEIERRATAKE